MFGKLVTTKEDIFAFTSPVGVFTLTYLLSKDLFHVNSITEIALTGGFSGLISAFWYYLIRHKSFFFQLLLTGFYVTLILLIGFFYVRKDKPTTERSGIQPASNFVELKNKLEGTWVSRPLDSADSFLKFHFFSGDSLVASVNEQSFGLTYEIMENQRILAYDLNDALKFDLTIQKLDSDSLIFKDENKLLKFHRYFN